ncbi:MAG: gluconokinase [Microcoleus sp. PH2017_03_ELD_O_A]|uniref:gluconokinase n=1 Tax=unclassified Microcoleus TaxID=2642155 RepID=UPI001DA4C38E|nr:MULTISPECIES: gluconokinase [unclassified Microcoleus]MCC3444366.1 gluconokinase [Microcoleus sp. PH2017_03_ELD_O_A]TAF84633.1 MAG: gluconokinase [Oscillatoriales cyanobacterium]MCC3451450.1 gluconokinase [Microcoleus sp. PH2017_09_SFU_O_A]MCC3632341.1 gluconokinase [Microcoleus sp. PH2017_39_LGB_O_B]MCC3644585.1 gluconokinase [Microcoleus sp. PH2017_33_LGB_O_A]
MIIMVMGVSGSGKTTVGKLLAESLNWDFSDADDFHPPGNIEKMSRGIPLEDADRLPWLLHLQGTIDRWLLENKNVVLACSGLKASYREMLFRDKQQMKIVYLKGDFELFAARLKTRENHYMKVDLLSSQFATLEEPENAIIIDASQPLEVIVRQIINYLMCG